MAREEELVVLALIKLCRINNVGSLLQVGAEDGYEAFAISQALGIEANAIEADPKCEAFHTAIPFHRAYIGAKDEKKVPFYVNAVSGLSSSYKRGAGEEERHYNMITLDTFCANANILPDALIIDTEGSTLDVLEGATETLKFVKLIYAEVQTCELRPGIRPVTEVDDFLFARGFFRSNEFPAYSAGEQANVIYIRKPDAPLGE